MSRFAVHSKVMASSWNHLKFFNIFISALQPTTKQRGRQPESATLAATQRAAPACHHSHNRDRTNASSDSLCFARPGNVLRQVLPSAVCFLMPYHAQSHAD
jgi:hypothetical protein